jgi:hypothetical protein
MASQLRLHVLAPIAVVALLGLGVSAFIMSQHNPATSSDADAIAARIAARHHTLPAVTPPKPKPHATKPDAKPKPEPTKHAHHGSSLKAALSRHAVVVVLFYEPGANYDTIQTREARAGALSAHAGFLAVNVSKNKEVSALAAQYNVLESPTVLVFRRGPKLKARLEGFNDRTTIVQAVRNA